MYYQNYEDYVRNVLGARYTPEYTNQVARPYNYYSPTYAMPMDMPALNPYDMQESVPVVNNTTSNLNSEVSEVAEETEEVAKIKKMYPEIYTLLMPMIDKTIEDNNEKEVTEEVIETMTKQIYDSIQDDINIQRVSNVNDGKNINTNVRQFSNNQVARRPGNPTLRDLIKILLINSLINNIRPNKPNRPNRPMPDNRPPMPRMSYPVMSYFNTPYPEDENII